MTRRPPRTDRDAFGMGGLANAPAFPGTPEFSRHIEAQEAAGQAALVNSERFPTDAPTAELEALGFIFGDPDPGDPLFRPAALPEGWTREGSDHAMWSYILDDKARRRVAVFYKAAFYDRSAYASLVRPTSRLDEMVYGKNEPTAIELDDLLTADDARDHLNHELAENQRHLETWAKDNPTYVARGERITALLALLPEETTPTT